jgi:hypothetical protein
MTRWAVTWEWLRSAIAHIPFRLRLFAGAVLFAIAVVSVLDAYFGRIRGLPSTDRRVTLVQLDEERFYARLQEAQRATMTASLRCRRVALVRLGLTSAIEPSAAPTSALSRLAGRDLEAVAFYAAGTDTVFTRHKRDPEVRHEWIHAVDDQSSDRMRRAASAPTTDQAIALRAAIEGTALVAVRQDSYRTVFTGDLDHNAWVFAYTLGPQYVKMAAGNGLPEALALSPKTSYEVVYGKVPPGRRLIDAPYLLPGEELLCSDELGIAGTLTAFQRSNAPRAEAEKALLGWRGDRVDLIRGPTGERIEWRIAVGTRDAHEAWLRGPGLHIPLTAQRTVVLPFLSDEAPTEYATPSPFSSLGR